MSEKQRLVRIRSIILIITIANIIGMFVGELINIDIIGIVIFGLMLLTFYKINNHFFLKYFYLLVTSTLFLAGVFVCDFFRIWLYEINHTSYYCNAFWPALLAYSLFVGTVFYQDYKYHISVIPKKVTVKSSVDFKPLTMWMIIALLLYSDFLALRAGSSASLGLERSYYSYHILGPLANYVIVNMFQLYAIFFMIQHNKKRMIQSVLFVFMSLLLLFLSGNKFGIFLQILYITILNFTSKLKTKVKKKYIVGLAMVVFSLLSIVYAQYSVLYRFTFNDFVIYVNARLAQQGEVWWGVYQQTKYSYFRISEFGDELGTLFSLKLANELPYAGQWKMMLVSSDGFSTIINRIERGSPLTCTTPASIFYYFGYIGMLVFYPLLGMLYAFIVQRLYESLHSNNVIITFIYANYFLYVTYLSGASNIAIFTSAKGIISLIIILFLERIRCQNKKIVISLGKH